MIDLSDGLVQDLSHLCETNRLGANLNEANLPLSQAFKKVCLQDGHNPTDLILQGGEDYELLFTIRPEDVKELIKLFLKVDFSISHIGEITDLPGKIILKKKNGRKKSLKLSMGFNHFKRGHWS